jgi:outer membrane biogenesis lipoprotein LolB
MLITKKMLLALTLVGALLGAGVGALVTHSANNSPDPNTFAAATQAANQTVKTPEQIAADNSTQFKTTEEQTAYRQGFSDGYTGCASAGINPTTSSQRTLAYVPAARYTSDRSVAYNHVVRSSPRGRTFWQKHRDKLTLGIGTGLGAAIGGLAGGGKGAGIGALAGLGGSALYTYKLRKRTRRY